jgi:hypothetical protein
MIENIGDIELTDEYWDCECEKNFIKNRSLDFCEICESWREDEPFSRINEVLKNGLLLQEQS